MQHVLKNLLIRLKNPFSYLLLAVQWRHFFFAVFNLCFSELMLVQFYVGLETILIGTNTLGSLVKARPCQQFVLENRHGTSV